MNMINKRQRLAMLDQAYRDLEACEAVDPDVLTDSDIFGRYRQLKINMWVQALLAAGYVVFAINPLQVARYRERHSPSGAKSDPGDAHLLAEIVRLDRAHHRQIAGDSEIAEHVKIAARAHQSMIWSRVRQVNVLRSGVLPGRLGRVRD